MSIIGDRVDHPPHYNSHSMLRRAVQCSVWENMGATGGMATSRASDSDSCSSLVARLQRQIVAPLGGRRCATAARRTLPRAPHLLPARSLVVVMTVLSTTCAEKNSGDLRLLKGAIARVQGVLSGDVVATAGTPSWPIRVISALGRHAAAAARSIDRRESGSLLTGMSWLLPQRTTRVAARGRDGFVSIFSSWRRCSGVFFCLLKRCITKTASAMTTQRGTLNYG